MQPNNLFVIGLNSLYVNALINPIELNPNKILTGLKRVIYSLSNTIESACKHSIGLKTKTEMSAQQQHRS